jgi:hypothetical protein
LRECPLTKVEKFEALEFAVLTSYTGPDMLRLDLGQISFPKAGEIAR